MLGPSKVTMVSMRAATDSEKGSLLQPWIPTSQQFWPNSESSKDACNKALNVYIYKDTYVHMYIYIYVYIYHVYVYMYV